MEQSSSVDPSLEPRGDQPRRLSTAIREFTELLKAEHLGAIAFQDLLTIAEDRHPNRQPLDHDTRSALERLDTVCASLGWKRRWMLQMQQAVEQGRVDVESIDRVITHRQRRPSGQR